MFQMLKATTMMGFAALIVASPAPRSNSARRVACLTTTVSGPVQGLDQGTTCGFLGIPFAATTGGQNRWKPPQPVTPWTTTLPVTAGTGNCASLNGTTPQGSEDCLKLNVWVRNPLPAGGAPVIVWIHTGSFTGASANFAGTNGRKLAEEMGVIVVEANYRLGAFGFLAHRALEGEDGARQSTGNYGLLDQRAAMQWVRDNIQFFGGDPNNVTLGGTSAGGQSVGLHMVSPGSAGLFHHAIIESAYPTSRWKSRQTALGQGDQFATALGCTVPSQAAACLRGKTQNQVLLAVPQGNAQVLEQANAIFWEPVVDGVEIPDQPRRLFQLGEFAHVPAIVGTNRDEGWGSFITRSFPSPVTEAQYLAWLATEFGDEAPNVLAMYPLSAFPSPQEAMARVVGDGQFVCEARRLADLIAGGGLRGLGPHPEHDTGKREKMPVFMYSYEYVLNDLSPGHVIHGVETNIIFGNAYSTPQFAANHALTADDLQLHAAMESYWTLFAAAGDPNHPALTPWPDYRKNHNNYLTFDVQLSPGVDQRQDACAFWSRLFLQSMLSGAPASAP